MASQRWLLHDPTGTLPDYSFAVNPNQDAPQYQKNMQFQALVSPGSKPLLFEGQDNPTVFSVQGTILTEDQYTKFLDWYNLRHQVQLTDDTGRTRWIYITNFQPVRKKSALYPWRYDYTLSGYTISETFPSVTTPTPPSSSAPTVSGVAPSAISAFGGTSVVVTGTNFATASVVTIGGVPVPFTVNSGTQLTATAPSGTSGNTVHVEVTNPTATSSSSSADLLTFAGFPVVSSLTPNVGGTTGGTTVVIAGFGFTGATEVQFGSVDAASFVVNSDTQITAVTASESAAEVEVVVVTPVGSSVDNTLVVDGGSATTIFGDDFIFASPPTVTSVSPNVGGVAGGETITINGTNLNGATQVAFGSANAAFTVHSSSWITATAPVNTAGTVDVQVTTGGGLSATSSSDHYTYFAEPAITGISPTTGSSAGGTSVTVTGVGLTGTTTMHVGTTAVTGFTVVSDTEITFTTPAMTAGTYDITVTNPAATSGTSTADQFTYT